MQQPMFQITFLLAALLLAPALAHAEDAPAAATAIAAAEALEQHCSDVAVGEGTAVASATRDVATALTDVSRAFDEVGAAYLLYWRGLLYACIENDERAKADLTEFLAATQDDPSYLPQVREAKRRLARLDRAARGPLFGKPSPGAVALGIGLLGAGGALGGLAAWQGQRLRAVEARFRDDPKPWSERTAGLEAGQVHADAANSLIVGAIGSAAAGVAALLVSSAIEGAGPKLSAALAPTPDGVVMSLALRW